MNLNTYFCIPQTIDVTEMSQSIAKAVRDVCSGNNRFTLLHMSEILKGSDNKKIKDCGHNRSKYHGLLKDWARADVTRLLHKLVLDEYLKEELIFSRDIPQAYLKIGPKIEKLMGNQVQLSFAIHAIASKAAKKAGKKDDVPVVGKPSTSASGTSTLSSSSQKAVKELQDKCHNDLLDVCRRLANQRNMTLVSIMNMQAIKAMSEIMPATPEEMLQISHVTKANFEKSGKEFLAVTQQYAAEKMCLIQDLQDAEAASRVEEMSSDDNDEVDNTNWGALASQRSANSGGGGGSSWSGGGGSAGGSGRKRKRKFTSKSPRRKRQRKSSGAAKPATGKAAIAKRMMANAKKSPAAKHSLLIPKGYN